MKANQYALEWPEKDDGHNTYDGDPDEEVNPDRRRQRSFHPECQDNRNRPQDHDNKNRAAIAGIVRCQVELAMCTGIADFQQTVKKPAFSAARAFTGEPRIDGREPGPDAGLCHKENRRDIT